MHLNGRMPADRVVAVSGQLIHPGKWARFGDWSAHRHEPDGTLQHRRRVLLYGRRRPPPGLPGRGPELDHGIAAAPGTAVRDPGAAGGVARARSTRLRFSACQRVAHWLLSNFLVKSGRVKWTPSMGPLRLVYLGPVLINANAHIGSPVSGPNWKANILIMSLTASDHSGLQAQQLLPERQATVHDVEVARTSVVSRLHSHSTGRIH
jgi:hypothetical protein